MCSFGQKPFRARVGPLPRYSQAKFEQLQFIRITLRVEKFDESPLCVIFYESEFHASFIVFFKKVIREGTRAP